MGFLVFVKASGQSTDGRVTVMDHLGPRGSGSPLHVHSREDEWFYVKEGELTFWVGGEVIQGPAGSFVYGPRGIPHTFEVTSEEARFLLVAEPAGIENFMRTGAEPAKQLIIPEPPSTPPDPAQNGCSRGRVWNRDRRPPRHPLLRRRTMPLYRTDFEIDASDKQVWAVLTDFESYPDWNPSLPTISGELSEGSTVSLTLGMPGRPNLNVKATLQEVTPNRRITWHGNVGGDRLFAGDPRVRHSPRCREEGSVHPC